jgi:NAD(P)-dependent dehydrogenase (short-subunit alcohol dehydrogenase family)
LKDKIAVVTGGNSGIGLAAAKEFNRDGAQVIIVGRNPQAVSRAANEVGGNTLGLTADVSRVADLDAAYKKIHEKFGRIDVLFANAGVAKFAPAADSTEAMFDEITDINFRGTFFTVQRALPLLSEGAVILLTSTAVVHFGMPGTSIYAAGKAALNSLAKILAVELASRKIRVNVVSPGPIETPLFGKLGMSQEAAQEVGTKIVAQVPLARFGQAQEIGKAVAFLASADAAFITGQELVLDGGLAQS